MEPLTINDLSRLIEGKPTIKILIRIDRCHIDEFMDLEGDCIYWKFVCEVVGLERGTYVGVALHFSKKWACGALSDLIFSQGWESSDDEGPNEVEPSEAGPTFHGDDLIAL